MTFIGFWFSMKNFRKNGVGAAMEGFIWVKKIVVPVRKVMRCPMVKGS